MHRSPFLDGSGRLQGAFRQLDSPVLFTADVEAVKCGWPSTRRHFVKAAAHRSLAILCIAYACACGSNSMWFIGRRRQCWGIYSIDGTVIGERKILYYCCHGVKRSNTNLPPVPGHERCHSNWLINMIL